MRKIEIGQRPTTILGKVKERLQGRSLVVRDQDGNKVKVLGVTTLRRSIVGPRLRTIYEPSDYGGPGDLAFAEVDQSLNDIVTRMGKQRKVRRIKEIEIPRFNTVATGVVIEQTGSHGKDPNNSIIYSNTAPRGGNHLGDIEWHGNDGQGFVFGILKSGVPVFAVDAGNALSFIKEDLVGLWKVDVSANGMQFRSRDTFPAALRILSGRRGRGLIKEWIDPATIPDRPKLVEDKEKQTVTFPVAYKDGYGNLKTSIRLADLPEDIRQTEVLYVKDANGDIIPVYNKLAGAEPKTGEFFLTYGSSGPKDNPYIEINQMFGNAAKTLGITEFTDHTSVTLSLKAPEVEIEQESREADGFSTATKEDFPALYYLWHKAGLWTYDVAEEERRFNARLENDPTLQVVLRDGERIIGGAFGTVDRGASTAWIHRVVVDPEFQKRGHGAALLRELEERIKAGGNVRTIKLQVHDLNADADGVRGFYQRQGYDVDDVTTHKKSL